MFSIILNFSLKNFYKKNKLFNIAAGNSSLHCGVMKSLADIPSRLGGGDNRINKM